MTRNAYIANSIDTCVHLRPTDDDVAVIWRMLCTCVATKAADRMTVAQAMKDSQDRRGDQKFAEAVQACKSELAPLGLKYGTAGPRLSNGLPPTDIRNESIASLRRAVTCKWTFWARHWNLH